MTIDSLAPASARPEVAAMMDLTTGGSVSQAIGVAARLCVADELADGPRSAAELAEAVEAHPDSLYRLLRLVAEFGVFEELDGRRFALTPLGELLRSDVEGSMRGWAMLVDSPWRRHAWSYLHEAVRTGEPAFELAHGGRLFDYLREHPDEAALFDLGMTGISRQVIASIIDAYDFGRFGTVIDVGGGNGALLAAILADNPDMRGVLYELRDVTARARVLIAEAGVGDRCDVLCGDFFHYVPAGADAYLLTHVVHDWDDEAAIRILANCRAAMGGDARLLLGEQVLPDGPAPSRAKRTDLEMLVIGGRERTEAEYGELLERAGLGLTRVVPSAGTHSVIEAVAR